MSTDTIAASCHLRNVDAYVFDVFGTTVDWYTTMTRHIAHNGVHPDDAARLAREWRQGYYAHIANVNAGGQGSLNIDIAHREILDRLLASPRWSHLTAICDRDELVHGWHDLDVYDDTIPGLTELAKSSLVVALSNGNYRLLVDMAKNKQIPWDGIMSTEFFGVYKPSPKAYLSASYHLGVRPERIAMVAAHKWDLDGAAQAGFKTIYVPRPSEDTSEIRNSVKTYSDGGSVDLIVEDFIQLAALAAAAKK